VGDLPAGDGQALGDEQRLGVGFLEFHARFTRGQAPVCGGVSGARWYRVARPRTGPMGGAG
jgi:hypothetical protein